MKKIINILATFVLATSSAPYLVQKYVGDSQTTKYTEETQNYSLNEQNSNAFKQWASPGSGLDSWDEYLHNDVGAISGNTPYQPSSQPIKYQANVGGGVYLNLQNDTQSTFKQTYIDNQNKTHNAIGSYNYGSMNQNITQVDRSNELPQPPNSEAWESYFFNREPSAGYDLGTNNFAVNNLTPENKENDGVNRFLEGFLNTELNYWYYTNFSSVLQSDVPDYATNLKHYSDLHRILVKYFEKLLKFTFGGKYNDLETTSYTPNAYDKFAKPFVDVLIGIVGDELGPFGWLASWAVSDILDQFLGGVTAQKSLVNHSFAWQSDPLETTDMDNIFSEILGTDIDGKITYPTAFQSVIEKFTEQNHYYPDSLTINNFAFNVHNYTATNSWKNYLRWDAGSPTGDWKKEYQPGSYHQGGTDTGTTAYNLKNVTPEFNFDISADKASPTYSSEKKVLDDPNTAGPGDGLLIDSMSSKDWDQGLAIDEINQAWGSLGGLVNSLYSDVVYKQVLSPGEKTQPIRNKKEVECEMYFKDGSLGYTQNHPRYFYVEGE